MPPPEDHPPHCWRWLDWWVTPRWRALLTWVGCTALGGAVLDLAGFDQVIDATRWPILYADRFLSTPLPDFLQMVVPLLNCCLLLTWCEPFVLRLDLPRGLAWIAVRVATLLLWAFLPYAWWGVAAIFLFSQLGLGWLLRGVRSRPWMPFVCLPVCVVTVAAIGYLTNQVWAGFATFALTYGIPLLYGTRRLGPTVANHGRI